MTMCIAVGGSRQGGIQSDIFIIEYVEYDISYTESDTISLTSDMFFPNRMKEKQTFSFIHGGDVDFKAVEAREIFSANDFHTAFLRHLYAPSIEARLSRDGCLDGLSPPGVKAADLSRTENYFKTLQKQETKIDGSILFALYTVTVPPQECGYVRVRTVIRGEVLNWVTKGKTCFDVYGGGALIARLRDEIRCIRSGLTSSQIPSDENKSSNCFDDFVRGSYIVPARYDIVLSCTQKSLPMRFDRRTADLFIGWAGLQFREKEITWYWSSSPTFRVLSYPQDPPLPDGPYIDVDLIMAPQGL